MSAERYAFDTNILFYALDTRVVDKHSLARTLIGQASPTRCIVPLQTLGEICSSVTRKRPDLLSNVAELVQDLSELYDVVPGSSEDALAALAVHRFHGLQFWDAMLWATARRAGCKFLFTEDLQDGRNLEGVTFRNPFHLSPVELAALLA